jgi:aldose 1-epimerase
MVPAMNDPSHEIVTEYLGAMRSGAAVNRHTLSSVELSCSLLDYGAAVQTLEFKSKTSASVTPLVLSYPSLAGYEADPFYMGCMVGRTAGRIGGSAYVLDGKQARLTANEGNNHLHGGTCGFNKRLWQRTPTPPEHEGECIGPHITLSLLSPDGDEGHLGEVQVWVTYEIRQNSLFIHSLAKSPSAAHVNLTNHMYFNLGGSLGPIDDHRLFIASKEILETSPDQVPTGRIIATPSPLSWATERAIGAQAIDHAYVLEPAAPAARLSSPATGIAMTVITDQPAMQVYTGDYLTNQGHGVGLAKLRARQGICFETQGFANAPNCPDFPSSRIDSGSYYKSKTEFRFST